MLRIIETFSGIGSQVQALKNINIDHKVEAIVEWEIGAMYAYDIMHNGPQDLTPYRHHTKDSLIEILEKYNLSIDGKEPITDRALSIMNVTQLKAILCAIDRNNNFVDIQQVEADNLPDADVLTYSFPCQDLSVSGHWHNNTGGIDRNADNRSTLLWEIERILLGYTAKQKKLPKFLLMENVSNILSSKHIKNFNEWQGFLERLGYLNKVYTLNSKNFGVPQSRERTYLLSVLVEDNEIKKEVESYLIENNLENYRQQNCSPLGNYLKLNYSIEKYRVEAIESTPKFTPSREKIYENNIILANGRDALPNQIARTLTTKQDRHPNSGIIKYDKEILTNYNTKYRNLTPRECFLLMGFTEEQFDLLMNNNIDIAGGRKILPLSKLIRLAGNSIVVQVLESIFKQVEYINENLLNEEKKEYTVAI